MAMLEIGTFMRPLLLSIIFPMATISAQDGGNTQEQANKAISWLDSLFGKQDKSGPFCRIDLGHRACFGFMHPEPKRPGLPPMMRFRGISGENFQLQSGLAKVRAADFKTFYASWKDLIGDGREVSNPASHDSMDILIPWTALQHKEGDKSALHEKMSTSFPDGFSGESIRQTLRDSLGLWNYLVFGRSALNESWTDLAGRYKLFLEIFNYGLMADMIQPEIVKLESAIALGYRIPEDYPTQLERDLAGAELVLHSNEYLWTTCLYGGEIQIKSTLSIKPQDAKALVDLIDSQLPTRSTVALPWKLFAIRPATIGDIASFCLQEISGRWPAWETGTDKWKDWLQAAQEGHERADSLRSLAKYQEHFGPRVRHHLDKWQSDWQVIHSRPEHADEKSQRLIIRALLDSLKVSAPRDVLDWLRHPRQLNIGNLTHEIVHRLLASGDRSLYETILKDLYLGNVADPALQMFMIASLDEEGRKSQIDKLFDGNEHDVLRIFLGTFSLVHHPSSRDGCMRDPAIRDGLVKALRHACVRLGIEGHPVMSLIGDHPGELCNWAFKNRPTRRQ